MQFAPWFSICIAIYLGQWVNRVNMWLTFPEGCNLIFNYLKILRLLKLIMLLLTKYEF